MADTKFSQFTTVATFDDDDYIVGYRGAANIKVTKQQVETSILGSFPSMSLLKLTSKGSNFTQLLGANTRVMSFDFKLLTGNPVIKVGTTNGGDEILFEETLTANASRPVAIYFENEQTLYFEISEGVADINILTINTYF